MSDIFMSYSSADRDRVKLLVKALQGRGWSVWWDHIIPPGKTWDQVIQAALGEAKCVIVVWSTTAVASEWVRAEAEEAKRRRILVPVLLDQVEIPLGFRWIQAANLIGWSGSLPHAAFDTLAEAVREILAGTAHLDIPNPTNTLGTGFETTQQPGPRDGENSERKGQMQPSLEPEVRGAKPLNTVFTPAQQSSTQRPWHPGRYLFVAGVVLALAWAIWSTRNRPFASPESSPGIYRVRVTVVDDHHIPVEDAVVRVTAANEVKTAANGDAELAIPKGSLPHDGRVTIFADKESAFQHGRRELSLAEDMNPSVIIPVVLNRTAAVHGAVQDEAGHRLVGVRVSIPGVPAVETDADGNFRIQNAGSTGQKVLLHAEKTGYKAASEYHPAGEDPAILILSHVSY